MYCHSSTVRCTRLIPWARGSSKIERSGSIRFSIVTDKACLFAEDKRASCGSVERHPRPNETRLRGGRFEMQPREPELRRSVYWKLSRPNRLEISKKYLGTVLGVSKREWDSSRCLLATTRFPGIPISRDDTPESPFFLARPFLVAPFPVTKSRMKMSREKSTELSHVWQRGSEPRNETAVNMEIKLRRWNKKSGNLGRVVEGC